MAASVVHRSQAVLWLCATLLIGHAVTSWRGTATESAPTRLITAARPLVDRFGVDSLAMVANRLVQTNPFRLSRQPAIVPFVADAMLLPPAEPGTPKPLLVLSGLIGGPPWSAVLEGVPGRDGSVVVRVGDRVDDLKIERLIVDTLLVTGYDTTWKLTVRRVGQ